MSAYAASGALFAAADFISGGNTVGVRALSSVIGLGAGAGALFGSFFSLALSGLARTRRRVASGVWLASGLAAGIAVASSLGAFRRIGSRNHDLAVITLIGTVIAGLVVGGLLAYTQPIWSKQKKLTIAPSLSRPRGAALAVLIAALSLTAIDRAVLPGAYPTFHDALSVGALAALGMIPLLLRVELIPRRLDALATLGLVAIILVPGIVLRPIDRELTSAMLDRPFASIPLRVARALVDLDRDGYANLFAGGDCEPFDPAIHPGAREIAANGIDDNCQGGDVASSESRADVEERERVTPIATGPSALSVVLITVDALRPDRMSAYGYARRTTPSIDAWFADGRRFSDVVTPGGYTSIAIPALMRGVYPRRVHWSWALQTNRGRLLAAPLTETLASGERLTYSYSLPRNDPHTPIAGWLARRGMLTGAVVDDGGSGFLAPAWGTDTGFQIYDRIETSYELGDETTATQAIQRIAEVPSNRAFFLWIHFYGPHAPDSEHADVPRFGTEIGDRYDHEIAHTDRHIGRVLEALATRGFTVPVVTILTSDHGERLNKTRLHGRDHGESSIRVPLLMRGPGVSAGSDASLVSTVDLFPTILALTNTPAPSALDGFVLPGVLGATAQADRIVITETWIFDDAQRVNLDLVSALDHTHRFGVDRVSQGAALYRRTDDDPPMRAAGTNRRLNDAVTRYLDDTGGVVRVDR